MAEKGDGPRYVATALVGIVVGLVVARLFDVHGESEEDLALLAGLVAAFAYWAAGRR